MLRRVRRGITIHAYAPYSFSATSGPGRFLVRSRSFFSFTSSTEDENSNKQPQSLHHHIPVLLEETIEYWSPIIGAKSGNNAKDQQHKQQYFVDGTVGFGGHSRALLERFPGAKLLCIDRDPEILAVAKKNLREFSDRVVFQEGSYVEMPMHLQRVDFPQEVDGILVDLGANSFHFDAPQRGFSWMHDGPLDMRFNQQSKDTPTAADVVNTLSEIQLTKIFKEYGEDRLAKEYAKAIVRERDERHVVFRTTQNLRECIERISRKWQRNSSKKQKKNPSAANITTTHPATKCFQALRIYVNNELKHVEDGVHTLVDSLAPGGRLLTIAFHSLEDRPIKTLFRKLDSQSRRHVDGDDKNDFVDEFDDNDEDNETSPRNDQKRFRLVKRKAIKAKRDEIAANPRSRSARLRCLERTQ